VTCHFEKESQRPKVIRLHFVRDEVCQRAVKTSQEWANQNQPF